MAKALITGGAGYTGILLTASLLEAGHEVTIVDNFMFGYDSVMHLISHPDLNIIKSDIRNEDLSYLDGPDIIYHLAAISGFPACDANPSSAMLINIEASRRIASTLSKDQLLVFASTTSFYGSTGSLSTEETPVNPVSLYGITKYKAEQAIMERENSISLRWATVFGASPHMRGGLLVNEFVENAVQERTIVLYDASSRRSFMHISDLVRGYLFALDHVDEMRGEIFNMGSDRMNYTKREIAEKIRSNCDCEIMEAGIGDKDIRNFQVSYGKAKQLGYDCKVSLESGILELIKIYEFYTPKSFIVPI